MVRVLGVLGVSFLLATDILAGQSVPTLDNETSGSWFVELASPPAIEGTAIATLEREEEDFHTAAAGAGLRYSEGRHYRKLWNGLTVRASAGDITRLRAVPGVRAVYPVVKIAARQIEQHPEAVADLATALEMTGADIAQNTLGLSGRGVEVAVIDSGIDYDHPDLGGCFGRGCRVEKGFDFVGDAFNGDPLSPGYNPTPRPDPFPDDCNGHGTHVGGIIAGNGATKGIAPRAKLHAYRIFGCEGPTTADVMLAAMEMVLEDGADVVNMSIGSPLQWPQYPTAKGADALVNHGIVVVASIGNEGTLGLYAAGAPGVGKNVIGVASFDNSHANLNAFTIAPDAATIGYLAATGAPVPPLTGSFPMARAITPPSIGDTCSELAEGSLIGKVALIQRGGCSFFVKAFNAQAAGAAGVVFYNNAAGLIASSVADGGPIAIPVVSISLANGLRIDSLLATGPVTMTWTSLSTNEAQPTGGLISSFSSYGAAPDLSLKPDLGAPGGMVRSTFPLEQGGYGNLSGSSMASPHVAGAIALLLEARPNARPREIVRRLQNTARPKVWWGNPGLGFLDNVHRQGAGLLQIDDAVLADAVVSPSSLALGEVETGAVTRTLRISRAKSYEHEGRWPDGRRGRGEDGDDGPVTYTLGHQPALSTGSNTFTPSFFSSFATVAFSAPSITLADRRHHDDDVNSVAVTITPPAPDVVRLFGGYITLTPSDGGTVLRVPYGGYHGDYQAIVAMTPTPFGFPWVAKLIGTNLFKQGDFASFTLVGDDVPFILLHLDHQVRNLTMEIIDSTGSSVGFADIEHFLGRNSTATSFFALTWDGTAMKRTRGRALPVPNGAYRIEMSVLKALGNPEDPAHVEKWTSPAIVIGRP
jgi:minor extracellular serine protease Vpr